MSKHAFSPVLGSYIWGSCCQLVTPTSPLVPLSFSKLKTFLVHRLDLNNAKSKDANSNGIYFSTKHTRLTLIILYLATENGSLSVDSWAGRILQSKTLDTAAKTVFLKAHLSEWGAPN